MIIDKSIDVEKEVRIALDDYLTVYCRPLPAKYGLPNILITQVSGTTSQRIDIFEVVLDSRAKLEAEAVDYLNTAIGILEQVVKQQITALRYMEVNSSGSWGADPVRPDLAMYSARIVLTAHKQKVEV